MCRTFGGSPNCSRSDSPALGVSPNSATYRITSQCLKGRAIGQSIWTSAWMLPRTPLRREWCLVRCRSGHGFSTLGRNSRRMTSTSSRNCLRIFRPEATDLAEVSTYPDSGCCPGGNLAEGDPRGTADAFPIDLYRKEVMFTIAPQAGLEIYLNLDTQEETP